jgi:hypothetical protein
LVLEVREVLKLVRMDLMVLPLALVHILLILELVHLEQMVVMEVLAAVVLLELTLVQLLVALAEQMVVMGQTVLEAAEELDKEPLHIILGMAIFTTVAVAEEVLNLTERAAALVERLEEVLLEVTEVMELLEPQIKAVVAVAAAEIMVDLAGVMAAMAALV